MARDEAEGMTVEPHVEYDAHRVGLEGECMDAYMKGPASPQHDFHYWDQTTGEPLPAHLARAARAEEIAFMKDWRVWDKVPTSMSWRVSGRAPLRGQWVDVHKGECIGTGRAQPVRRHGVCERPQ